MVCLITNSSNQIQAPFHGLLFAQQNSKQQHEQVCFWAAFVKRQARGFSRSGLAEKGITFDLADDLQASDVEPGLLLPLSAARRQ